MHLKPLYDKIVVKLADKQEIVNEAGLVYVKNMSTSNHTTLVGEVVAVGEGRLLASGEVLPLKVKIGDKVVYSKMQGESFNDGVTDFTILSEACVSAILEEEN